MTATEHLISQILHLQARCDALDGLVQMLMLKQGVDAETLHKTLRAVRATAFQKRLEALEDSNPALAALLAQNQSMQDIDLDLLDGLRFEDDGS